MSAIKQNKTVAIKNWNF